MYTDMNKLNKYRQTGKQTDKEDKPTQIDRHKEVKPIKRQADTQTENKIKQHRQTRVRKGDTDTQSNQQTERQKYTDRERREEKSNAERRVEKNV